MNWRSRIKRILGKFWIDLFLDTDLIHGLSDLYCTFCGAMEAAFRNWLNGLTPAIDETWQDAVPFPVYIDVQSVHKAYTTYSAILNGGEIGAEDAAAGWIAESKYDIPFPSSLQDHVHTAKYTLFHGLDYKYSNREFLFYENPSVLEWPTVKMTDKEGNLHIYYKIFGRTKRTCVYSCPVAGFAGNELNFCARDAWDVHQNGATVYNTKKLLADVSDSVICEQAGTVTDVWYEQTTHCMSVNDRVYISGKLPNFSKGADVKAGDVLFGELRIYNSSDNPSSADIPGINVRTDAGELTALNADLHPVVVDGIDTLPLTGDAGVLLSYKNKCVENSKDDKCPSVDIPQNVNPYKFIVGVLRRGRGVAALLSVSNVGPVGAALSLLRRCTCASGILNVYVKAENEDAAITPASFFADAGMAAVAVDATVRIKTLCAEAKVLL